MRKFTTIIAALFMTVATYAQTPQGFSYQAVVRDAQNAIVANQTVDVTVAILQGSDLDHAQSVYTEQHSVSTNQNGLFTLTIGSGKSSDKFSAIDWSKGGYFINTKTAYGESTTQLMSVPYAMYAQKAGDFDVQMLAKAMNNSDVQAILNFVKPEDLKGVYKYINDSLNYYSNTYVKKTEVNALTNNYVTKETFENYVISGGQSEAVDLTVYAKTADVEAAYAKKSDIPAAPDLTGYAKNDTLDKYVLKTNLSANYVTKDEFNELALSSGQAEAVDLTVYAKTADVEKTYAKKSDIPATPDLTAYAKTANLATVAKSGSYADLTNVPTNVSAFTNDAQYLKADDIAGKQDVISDLATIREGAAKGTTAVQPEALTAYATTAKLNDTLDVYATSAKLNDTLDVYTTSTKLNDTLAYYTKTADIANNATIAQLQAQIEALQEALAQVYTTNVTVKVKYHNPSVSGRYQYGSAETVMGYNTLYVEGQSFSGDVSEYTFSIPIYKDGLEWSMRLGDESAEGFCTIKVNGEQLTLDDVPLKDGGDLFITQSNSRYVTVTETTNGGNKVGYFKYFELAKTSTKPETLTYRPSGFTDDNIMFRFLPIKSGSVRYNKYEYKPIPAVKLFSGGKNNVVEIDVYAWYRANS